MGHDEMLIGFVERAREGLAVAKRNVDNTPKPANACAAHDGFFALNQASAGALDALLRIQEETLKDTTVQPAPAPLTVWGFICANARSVIWAAALIVSVAIIFGQLDALSNFVSRFRQVNCAVSAEQYEPGG